MALSGIVFGLLLRTAFAWRAGVGSDEAFVIGLGLDEIGTGIARWFVEVPVRRSDAVTPLWWWLQGIPAILIGYPTLWGMRILSVVLGGLGLMLFWSLASRRLGRGPAVLALFLGATSDVAAFASARGEFAEPLLLFVALPATCLVGNFRRMWFKGALWFLLVFTHFGKGGLIVAGLILADAAWVLLHKLNGRLLAVGTDKLVRLKSLAVSAAVAYVPTFAWLFYVDRAVFFGGLVETDTGPRNSVWDAIFAITFGYGTTKLHMIAAPWDSLQVFFDGRVWPLTTISFVPLLAGIIASIAHAFRVQGKTRRGARVLALMPWLLLAVALVIGRGMIGSRFHLLYLPAAWVIAALGLWRLRKYGWGAHLALMACWSIHLAIGFSWASWTGRTLHLTAITVIAGLAPVFIGLVGAVAWNLNQKGKTRERLSVKPSKEESLHPAGPNPSTHDSIRRESWLASAVAVALGMAAATWTAGPWRWGPAARFEPMAERTARADDSLLAAIDRASTGIGPYPSAHGRSLHIDLANYFLTRPGASEDDFERAVTYALLATRYDRNVARAWVYVGLAYHQAKRPASEIRSAWEQSYAINPDPRVAEWLSRLPE
jgi:hypothetical protein